MKLPEAERLCEQLAAELKPRIGPKSAMVGLPLLDEMLDVLECGDRGQRMRGAELGLAHCNANTL